MYFLLLGLLLLLLKFAGIEPVYHWPWWGVLLPFGLAVVWWIFADATGYYQRGEVRKMEQKAALRRERQVAANRPGGNTPRSR